MWRRFGLQVAAEAPSAQETPGDAKLDLLVDQVDRLAKEFHQVRRLTRAGTDSPQAPVVGPGQVGALIAAMDMPEVVGVSGSSEEFTINYIGAPSTRLREKTVELHNILRVPIQLQEEFDHPDAQRIMARNRDAHAG